MKNKWIAVILLVVCLIFALSGCGMGSYIDSGKNNAPSAPDGSGGGSTGDPDNPTPPSSDNYTADVYLNNERFLPGDLDITVVWRNKNDVKRVALGADGTADAGELDGTYTVYLTGLPSEYSYDPNGYTATAEQKKVSILLTAIRQPDRGDGSSMYVNTGCYSVRYEGTYRAKLSRGSTLFYEYKPLSAGVYAIESWVNVYDDEINPVFHLYYGSTAMKWYANSLDGGGAALDGGYTKNFRYEYAVDVSEVGNACTFAVGATSKSQEYPVYVDFCIKYIGEYSSDYADIRPQSAKEIAGKTPEPNAGETFTAADMGTKLFDARNFRYNRNTGWYHRYDAEKYADNPLGYGVGYGPVLLCAITKSIPCYGVVESLYKANAVGPNSSNYLRIFNVWIEEEGKFAVFDYTNFIRVDYYGICNSKGYCYVTEELKTFLQRFAENHSLYTDGVGAGENTPEGNGYTANQDALWLFACGFFE